MPTVLHRLQRWATETPNAVAQRFKRDFKKENPWEDITAAEFRDRVFYLALYFESKGFKPGQSGAIYSYNCPHWVQTELAFTLIRGMAAGIYPNSIQKDIAYIVKHTDAKIFAVQDRKYFEKLGAENVPAAVEMILAFDDDTSISPKAVAFSKALEEGKKLAAGKKIEDYLSKIDPKAGAYLIYTSGTTAEPKGAILSYDNLAFAADMTIKHWDLPASGQMFSFLPLCHVAEQLQNVGVGISGRYCVNYATKIDNLAVEMPQVRPTLLLCVPRVWEKIMEGVQGKLAKAEGVKKVLADWSLAVGARVAEKQFSNKMVGPVDMIQIAIANKLVISKIKDALGLDRVELGASGAAALPAHVARWYRSIGLEIVEDFGQTETSAILCMTKRGKDCAGTVGVPTVGTEFKLAEDGEVMTRGRHVFVGYLKNEQATKDTVEQDGWLHTGDLAEMTDKGYVKIKGRKKEIMKTSGGKMIAPVPIEEQIKTSTMISQVCMVGDGRKYFSALITLTEDAMKNAKPNGTSDKRVVKDPDMLSMLKQHMDTVNKHLASYEKIKYFTVLARDFSVDEGEMTPTLKMKRNVIESRYRDLIDQMYGESASAD